jgi:hypothetical protein
MVIDFVKKKIQLMIQDKYKFSYIFFQTEKQLLIIIYVYQNKQCLTKKNIYNGR